MCTLHILYLSKEQFVDGIFALLPNSISPKLYEPQGVLCGGVWTLKSHDCKMLCFSLLNYTWQSLIDCPFFCLSSFPGSVAIIPLWMRRLLILRQWNVIPWLSFFYFFFFFHLVWEITFCLEMIYKHSLCSDTLRTSNCTCHTCVTTEQHLDSARCWQPLLQVHIVASPECLRVFCHPY